MKRLPRASLPVVPELARRSATWFEHWLKITGFGGLFNCSCEVRVAMDFPSKETSLAGRNAGWRLSSLQPVVYPDSARIPPGDCLRHQTMRKGID